jgi:hypothetical protein
MAANPAVSDYRRKKSSTTLPGSAASTPRDRRLELLRSALPGEGLSKTEKDQRLSHIRLLESVIDDDKDRNDRSNKLYIISAVPGRRAKLPTAKELLVHLSTKTLNALAGKYPDTRNTLMLTDALERILNSGEWRYESGGSSARLQSMMLDMVSFHRYLADSISRAECWSASFRKAYEVTGHEPGTLDSLTGKDRAGVEAILFVVSSALNTFNYNRFPSTDESELIPGELPLELARRILEVPDVACPLMEYMNSRGVSPVEVEWDNFLSYMEINAPLREGAL